MKILKFSNVYKRSGTYKMSYENYNSTYISNSERKNKKEQKHTINSFFSLCRNVSTFRNINSNKVVLIFEEIIEKIKNLELIDKYILILNNLEYKIFNNTLTESEALFTFINIFDPELKLYTMVRDNKKKKEIIKKVGFYSTDLVKAELIYYRALADLFEKDNSKTLKKE